MNYQKMYEENRSFKGYVDRYCVKHNLTPEQAFTHLLVQYYAKYLVQAADGKVVTTTQIDCGC